MTRAMPAPWVFNTISELLKDQDSAQEGSSGEPCCRPRVVQVVKVFEAESIMIINDKKHSIAVFLSKKCVNSFMKSSNQSIASLDNSMIKLEKWHFSTVTQCLGERQPSILKDLSLSMPLAISSSRIASLGAYGCVTIGRPVDINTVVSVRNSLGCMNYSTLAGRLANRVFRRPHLPDSEGRFLLPNYLYGHNSSSTGEEGIYKLKLHHCLVPGQQRRQLNLPDLHTTTASGSIKDARVGGETQGETEVDNMENTLVGTEKEGGVWDVSEELEGMGLRGLRGEMWAADQEELEAKSSMKIDMMLRDPSEGEEGQEGTTSLLSYESVMRMQQEMGLRPKESGGDDPHPNEYASQTLQASAGDTQLPSPMHHVSSSRVGGYEDAEEDAVEDEDPGSQCFFSQNESGLDLESIEGQMLREGQEMRMHQDLFSTSAVPCKEAAPSPTQDSPSSLPGRALAVASSQQEFLALLASLNEANKNARPFIDHPLKATASAPTESSVVEVQEGGHEGRELVESEFATQPQVEYIPTPSPPHAKPSSQNSKSTQTRKTKPSVSPVSSKTSPVVRTHIVTEAEGYSAGISADKTRHVVPKENSLVPKGFFGRDGVRRSREEAFQEATQGELPMSLPFTPEESQSQSQSQNSSRSRTSYSGQGRRIAEKCEDETFKRTEGVYVGRRISKKFRNLGWFAGTVVSYAKPYYLIKYDDGDIERDVLVGPLQQWLVADPPDNLLHSQTDTITQKRKRGGATIPSSSVPPSYDSSLSSSSVSSQPRSKLKAHKSPTAVAGSATTASWRRLVSTSPSGRDGISSLGRRDTTRWDGGKINRHDSILSKNAPDAAKIALRSLFR